jgi:hypothetical protein
MTVAPLAEHLSILYCSTEEFVCQDVSANALRRLAPTATEEKFAEKIRVIPLQKVGFCGMIYDEYSHTFLQPHTLI